MSDHLPSIDLELPKKLNDRKYRQAFFLAESSALIAKQLIQLRKRRGLNQTEVADILETGQPAISRVERADYRNWSFNTLRRLAEALDARLRVYIEPAEDVLIEYEDEPKLVAAASAAMDGINKQDIDSFQNTMGLLVGSAADEGKKKQFEPAKMEDNYGIA